MIEYAKKRAEELCEGDDVVDSLTPNDCRKCAKYRDALKDALALLDDQ
jgi:hypothetical protein